MNNALPLPSLLFARILMPRALTITKILAELTSSNWEANLKSPPDLMACSFCLYLVILQNIKNGRGGKYFALASFCCNLFETILIRPGWYYMFFIQLYSCFEFDGFFSLFLFSVIIVKFFHMFLLLLFINLRVELHLLFNESGHWNWKPNFQNVSFVKHRKHCSAFKNLFVFIDVFSYNFPCPFFRFWGKVE